jgi:hypothetical protein
MSKVPFARLRTAGFIGILVACIVVGVLNHVLKGDAKDQAIDLGLCFIAACALLCRALYHFSHLADDVRLRRCEQEVMAQRNAIAGLFPETVPTLYARDSSGGVQDVPVSTPGPSQGGQLLAFHRPGARE